MACSFQPRLPSCQSVCLSVCDAHTITGGVGYQDKDFVEYDMNVSDEEWLAAYNEGQERLPGRTFERMMWKLELECAKATEKTLRAAGVLLLVLVCCF